jgi:D-threo-aldose 1-dehydrogenase
MVYNKLTRKENVGVPFRARYAPVKPEWLSCIFRQKVWQKGGNGMSKIELTRQSSPRLGLDVTTLGLGTAPLGNLFIEISDGEAIATIEAALERGINFVDTAPFYGFGLAERRVGQALKGVPRQNVIVSTKVGRLIQLDGSAKFDFSRDGVLRSLDESLQRLGLDYVDILLVHDPDEHYEQALNEAFPALAKLREQGVVKAIGAGMNQWQMLQNFARYADPDCFLLAGRYTLLEQTALAEFLPLCHEKGIGIFAGGIFNSGVLAHGALPGTKYNYRDAPPEILARVARLEEVCARYGVPLRLAALHFPVAHPAVTSRLIGIQSVAQLEENLTLYNTPVPPELWQTLKTEGLLDSNAPTPNG